uniref:Glypican 5c n=1 Tax=Hucho hucho TaxID=62062 RepID=A0A4W5RA42_9TELE
MLHCRDVARFPPDVKLGIQAKEFNLGFFRPDNLVSHGLRVFRCLLANSKRAVMCLLLKNVELLVCKHQGPSCCTRKMEESYQVAVRRETLQIVRSYSFELKYLISGHTTAFQDTFQYLLSFSQGHLSSLLEDTYSPLSREALPHVNALFSSLSLYIRGHNLSLEAAIARFYDNLFPLVYGHLVNPGMGAAGKSGECLRATRQDINPFGPHPNTLAQELRRALGTGRALSLALAEGTEVMNATEHVSLTKECLRGLTKMQYCSHCRGLTLIKPCMGYCLNVMRGCLASVAELDEPWRRYVAALEELTHAVAGQHSLELALLGVREHVNEAILHTHTQIRTHTHSLLREIFSSLIWSYIWQEVRKCISVSTSFCGQCAHSLSSLESLVCLRRLFSIARLCSLSLYMVKAFLNFGSVTVVRYSATVCSLFRIKKHTSLLYFFVNSFECVK